MKKLFSSTIIYAISPQLPRLVNIFLLPILTPFLSPKDYGINGLLFAYMGICEGIKDLGLGVILTNSFFQEPDEYLRTWKKIYGFLSIWSIAFGLLLFPIIRVAIPESEATNFWMIVICLLLPIILFDTTSHIGRLYLQFNQKPLAFVTISTASSFVAIFFNVVTIANFKLGYMGFLISSCISRFFLFSIFFYLVIFRWHIFPSLHFKVNWITEKIRLSIPLIPHFYSAYILNMSDRLLLDMMKVSTDLIGLYSFGYSFGTYFSTLGKGLGQAGTPIFLSLYKKETIQSEKRVRDMLFAAQIGILLIGFTLSLWIKEIISLLSRNPSLEPSYVYAIPVLMAYTYYPIYFGAISKLRFQEKTNVFWKISTIASIINVTLNIILIPILGIMGPAITTFISYMYMGFSGYFTKDFREVNKVNYHEKTWLIIICSSMILAFLLKDLPIVPKVVITFFFSLVSLISINGILKFFNKNLIYKKLMPKEKVIL